MMDKETESTRSTGGPDHLGGGRDGDRVVIDTSRRRLFRGAAAGTGVILAVSSKTALGTGICQSPSAKMSGNLSGHRHTSATCKGGLSPGFWKVPQHFGHWARAGANHPRFPNGAECNQSFGQIKNMTPMYATMSAGAQGVQPGDDGGQYPLNRLSHILTTSALVSG